MMFMLMELLAKMEMLVQEMIIVKMENAFLV